MNNNPLEKVIESKVVKYAKEKGFRADKFTSPSNRGVPDRLFISPTGTIGFIEFKRKGKSLTPLQKHVIDDMRQKNVDVRVVDDIKFGKEIIDSWLNPKITSTVSYVNVPSVPEAYRDYDSLYALCPSGEVDEMRKSGWRLVKTNE